MKDPRLAVAREVGRWFLGTLALPDDHAAAETLEHGADTGALNSVGKTPCQVLGTNVPSAVEQLLCGS